MSYKIYSDGNLIYDIDIKSLLLINPVLILEDSLAGSLEFTMPPTHSHYDDIERLKSKITVERDGVEIWEGRVLEERVDFYNRKKVTCEGELAYLNDTRQPQREVHDITVERFFTSLLNVHNSKVSADKQFQPGTVTVTDPNDSLYRYTNRETTLTCIRDKLIDRLGGHLRIRKVNGVRYLDYLAESPGTCEQTIEFGKNLLNFTQNFDTSEFVTAIIPLGARLDESEFATLDSRLTIKEVNDGKDYISSSTAVQEYGWIEQTVIWDDVHYPDILKRKAEQYLSEVQFEKLVLELSAVDLHNINPEIDSIDVLDQIRVISDPHGLNRLFPVTRRNIPLSEPSKEKITLGDNIRIRLSGESWKDNAKLIRELEAIPSKQEFLDAARLNATQLIHNALNGHVVITDDADELLIMDSDDLEQAERVWRWNLNGLGYSSNGYDGDYNLAITMDGTILGDRIAAGTISAAKLDVNYTGQVQQAIEDAESGAISIANSYTDTQITNSASSITLAAQSYTDNKLTDYATKALLNNGLQGKADTSALDNYATKALLNNGLQDIQNQLVNYATKSELTVDINQISAIVETKADVATLDQYATKSELTTDIEGIQTVVDTKADASALDNYATKSQLNSYATKSELTVGINGIQSQVNSKVGQSEFSTKLRQSATDIQIAWNNLSDYIKFTNGVITITDDVNGGSISLGDHGMWVNPPNASDAGFIGAGYGALVPGGTVKYTGIDIGLYAGAYLSFGYATGGTFLDNQYWSALMFVHPYSSSSANPGNYGAGWHLGYDLDAHNNYLSNFKTKQTYNGSTYYGYTGAVTISGKTLTFSNGILIRVQ